MSILSTIANFLSWVILKVLLLSGRRLGRKRWHLPFWKRSSKSAKSCELRPHPWDCFPGKEPPDDNSKKLLEREYFSFNTTFTATVSVFFISIFSRSRREKNELGWPWALITPAPMSLEFVPHFLEHRDDENYTEIHGKVIYSWKRRQ